MRVIPLLLLYWPASPQSHLYLLLRFWHASSLALLFLWMSLQWAILSFRWILSPFPNDYEGGQLVVQVAAPIITIEYFSVFVCSLICEVLFVMWKTLYFCFILTVLIFQMPSVAGGHFSNHVRVGIKHLCQGLCQQSAAIYAFSGYGVHFLVYWKSPCFKQEPDCFNWRL